MKFTLVAIAAAFLCFAAVSAAPASIDDSELDQYITSLTDLVDEFDDSKEQEFLSFDADDHELVDTSKIKKFLLKLKCITRAIQAGVKGTKYEKIFDEHREWMHPMLVNIKKCAADSDKSKAFACIVKELKIGVPSLGPFIKELLKMKEELKTQPELTKRIQAEIAKCG